MSNQNGKLIALEKARDMTTKEIEEMSLRVDQANVLYNQAEKKIKMMDKVIAEWKGKADSTSMDLNNSQKECRNASAELFRIKNGYEESAAQLDDVKRENRQLGDEIKDLMEQISEGGRSIHEIEKMRKKLEAEKFELEAALGDAESALEQEENKLLRLNLEVNQVRVDIEKRIQEKEEEFEGTKRNHSKQLEQMQYNIEAESKAKAEAMRMRKKLELDIAELESATEHASMANMELQRNLKGYQDRVKEWNLRFEEEQRAKDAARDAMLNAERRSNTLQGRNSMLVQKLVQKFYFAICKIIFNAKFLLHIVNAFRNSINLQRRTPWRRPRQCWSRPTGRGRCPSRSWLTRTRPSPTSQCRIRASTQPRGS